jgi:hypothetical protein
VTRDEFRYGKLDADPKAVAETYTPPTMLLVPVRALEMMEAAMAKKCSKGGGKKR